MTIAKEPMVNQHRLDAIDGETLMTTPLPPIRFTIGGLLPQGLHILAGAPKVGKSWLALWLCLCVAKGDHVWEFPSSQERPQRRIRRWQGPYRMIRMSSPEFTGLTRFLAPRNGSAHGYDEVQNVISTIDAENRYLITPSSVDFYPMQGSIEDHASNLPMAVTKCLQIVDNLRYLVGMEALYAAQAIDLREDGGYVRLGRYTQHAYDAVRTVVPELIENRSVFSDIQSAYELVRSEKLLVCDESVG